MTRGGVWACASSGGVLCMGTEEGGVWKEHPSASKNGAGTTQGSQVTSDQVPALGQGPKYPPCQRCASFCRRDEYGYGLHVCILVSLSAVSGLFRGATGANTRTETVVLTCCQ